MINLESIFLKVSMAGIVLTIIFAIIASIISRRSIMAAIDKKSGSKSTVLEPRNGLFLSAKILTILSLVFVTLTIVFRAIQTGHGPFSNMYEFALAFVWGIIIMGVIFEWRYKTSVVRNVGLIVAFLLLGFAMATYTKPEPLVPALQPSTLLSIHVATAVFAYGIFTIGFVAAIFFLIQNQRNLP